MYVYAQINKETLRFIREKKAVSYDYVVRLTKYSKEKTAMKYGLTVITGENKKGEKKIPFVCRNLKVPCVDIWGLCEQEGWTF